MSNYWNVNGFNLGSSDLTIAKRIFVAGDASFGGRMFFSGNLVYNSFTVQTDASMLTRLFVGGDVSLNQRMYVAGDVSMGGNLQVTSNIFSGGFQVLTTQSNLAGTYAALAGTNFTGDTSHNARVYVLGDVSFNRRLNVVGDVSMGGNLQVTSNIFSGGFQVLTTQSNLAGTYAALAGTNFTGDVSHNARVYVVGDTSLNSRLFVTGDVSLNSRLNNVTITAPTGSSAILTLAPSSTLATVGAFSTTLTSTAATTVTLPTTGTLATLAGSETLQNKSLTNPTVTGNLQIDGSTGKGITSTSGILLAPSAGNGVRITGNLTVDGSINFLGGTITQTNTVITVTEELDISNNGTATALKVLQSGTGATFNIAQFIAPNNRTVMMVNTAGYVGINNISPDSELDVSGALSVTSDASLNSRLFVIGDVSLNQRLYVLRDVSMGGNLQVTNNIYSNGYQVLTTQSNLSGTYAALAGGNFTGDVSHNARVYVLGDVSLNQRMFVTGDVSMNSRLYVGSVGIGGAPSASNLTVVGGTASAIAVGTTATPAYSNSTVYLQNARLGATAGNFSPIMNTTTDLSGGNISKLGIYEYRFSTGTHWTSTSTRIQRTIDVTNMAYIEFGPPGQPNGLGLYVTGGVSNLNAVTAGITISNTGNVGIGTSMPNNMLQIQCNSSTAADNPPDYGTYHGILLVSPKTGSTSYAMSLGVDYTSGFGYINCGGNGLCQPVCLQTRGSNVGIGMTNPQYTLDVNGNARFGNVGIGGAPSAYNLHVYGTANFNGSSFYSTSSGGTMTFGFYNGIPSGNYNTGYGAYAIANTSTGIYNTAVGYNSLQYNTTANYSTAMGANALQNCTIGSSTAFGYSALQSNTTGNANSAFGLNALQFNTTAGWSTAMGFTALQNSTGGNNTGFGGQAGYSTTTGGANTTVGVNAGYNNTTGSYNTAVGYFALGSSTGAANSYNTALGHQAGNNAGAYSYSTAIGYNSTITASNQIVLGTSSEKVYIPGNVGIGTSTSASSLTVVGGTTTLIALGTTATPAYSNSTVYLQNARLGATAGNFSPIMNTTTDLSGGNVSKLGIYEYRFSTGTDWTSTSTRIQRTVDTTNMAYIEFSPPGQSNGLGLYVNGGVTNLNAVTAGITISSAGLVGIGSSNPVYNLDVNGTMRTTGLLRTSTISEVFVTNTGTTSPYTLDFSTSATFYITTPPSSNFTCNITNLPTDINRTYVITLVMTATTNKTFCSSVQLNSNTAITPLFMGGMPTITTASVITQSISIQRVTTGDVAANVVLLSAVSGWY